MVRWRHPVRGLMPPEEFMPIAEQSGLIVPLGKHLIGLVCEDLVNLRQEGLVLPYVSLDVSMRQLADKALVEDLQEGHRPGGQSIGGHPERALSKDTMLDTVSLYWFTASAASSARLYWHSFRNFAAGEILVPSADFHRAKMLLAAQGMPEAMPDGDTVLTDLPMGASRSMGSAVSFRCMATMCFPKSRSTRCARSSAAAWPASWNAACLINPMSLKE